MSYLGLPVLAGVVAVHRGVHGARQWWWSGWPTSRCATRRALNVLITAIGVSYFLQNAALHPHGVRPQERSRRCMSLPALRLFDGAAHHLGDGGHHDPGVRGHHGGADALHLEDEDGQGHARLLRGPRRRAAHGHQRERHHLDGVRHRVGARGHRRRAHVRGVPDAHAHDGLHARHQGLHGGGARRHRVHPGRRRSAACCSA